VRIQARRPCRLLAGAAALVAATALLASSVWAPPCAIAAAANPIYVYYPEPPPPPSSGPPLPSIPPPNSFFNGPCGVALDSGGRFYLADHYHDSVDVFSTPSRAGYLTQLRAPDPANGPCALALDPGGDLYFADYHGAVRRYAPDVYPPEAGPHPPDKDPPEQGTGYAADALIDPGPATGLTVDGAGDVYVAHRDRVSVYDPGGAHLHEIGAGELGQGYGVAVSGFPATAGNVYVADASTETVRVYDAAGAPLAPIAGPPGGFSSLRDASLALDDATGELYVLDDTQPAYAEEPRGRVYVFSADGAYEGHLKHDIVDGSPAGLAVDNSGGATQGRVYVTSGDSHHGGLYVYPPGAVTNEAPLGPKIPSPPLIGGLPIASIDVGGAASAGSQIPCTGDSCRSLPTQPADPTLTTLLEGLGNPRAHYRRYTHPKKHLRKRHCKRRARRECNHPPRRATVSAAWGARQGEGSAAAGAADGTAAAPTAAAPARVGTAAVLVPGTAGFDASARADGGAPATLAGSHPDQLALHVGLDQSGGGADLRDLRIDLPPGFLANPAALALCSQAAFATPRSSPFEPSSSGESCPDPTQVGTVEVATGAGGGQARRFGLFDLAPPDGVAARFGAAPFSQPLVFDLTVRADGEGPFGLTLQATGIPQALAIHGLDLVLWGVPWAASHNTERGNCMNEAEPGFPWAKCSVGEPLDKPPLAFLTIPTECGSPLAFTARVRSWQEASEASATVFSRDGAGQPALLEGCETLDFNPAPQAFLTAKKASSPSGFGFHLTGADAGLLDPALRVSPPARRIVIHLPEGGTINPSVGAGLGACTLAQLAAESPFNAAGAGCPNDSKLGDYRVHVPFYQGFLDGSIYLAEPDNQATSAPGAENPFDSLVAAYLVAKSAQRGILVRVAGEIVTDPTTGNLVASFDRLPQLPYTDVDVDFHPGQRSILVSPPACGLAASRIQVTPWAGTASAPLASVESTNWPIESGIDGGRCPDGRTPPFAPGAVTGGVNSNVGSYTPYFVHLIRKDNEQEITSYSLTLPKGITGRLAGIPFCPDAAIAAARAKQGFEEIADPSCPAASQVGRTETGYGVGAALTYAPGRIYLAGPYRGQPLSLATINAATVGPFDLGTIVIRSAFSVDSRTAQLQIDSRTSDSIPHIIDGIPLHLRDVRIYLDRPRFTDNPSSCEPSQMISTLTGSGQRFGDPSDDSTATVEKHFQLLNCLDLGFRPKLGLRLRGASRRGAFPQLRATFASRGARDSNLKRIEVAMPHTLFLAQQHIRSVCRREEFAAERCPPGSAYGRAVAYTPLFDEPLRGQVYLRSSSSQLPDLVASLHSGAVHIVLEGQIGPSRAGGIQVYFDNLPDAPIERFVLTLYGGRRGLLTNSSDVCASPPLASVKALGQNNVGAIFTTALRGQCGKRARQHRSGRGGKR
jgi:DNA-binding beta-propeller fold protein YncE